MTIPHSPFNCFTSYICACEDSSSRRTGKKRETYIAHLERFEYDACDRCNVGNLGSQSTCLLENRERRLDRAHRDVGGSADRIIVTSYGSDQRISREEPEFNDLITLTIVAKCGRKDSAQEIRRFGLHSLTRRCR